MDQEGAVRVLAAGKTRIANFHDLKDVIHEHMILTSIASDHVLKSMCFHYEGKRNNFVFIQPMCGPFSTPGTPESIKSAFAPIGALLANLNAKDIVHNDFKVENMLMDEKGTPFLTDFGLSIHARKRIGLASENRGYNTVQNVRIHSPGGTYLVPEANNRQSRLDLRKIDSWSFGLAILKELDFSHYPATRNQQPYLIQKDSKFKLDFGRFYKNHVLQAQQKFFQIIQDLEQTNVDSDLINVLTSCLAPQDQRKTMKEVMDLPFFNDSPPKYSPNSASSATTLYRTPAQSPIEYYMCFSKAEKIIATLLFDRNPEGRYWV